MMSATVPAHMAVLVRNICLRAAGCRQIHRWVAPTLQELKRRRDKIGPEPPSHRSTSINWNYGAELFAFGKRLKEEFDEDLLKIAFTQKSYVDSEAQKRIKLGLTDKSLLIRENSGLAEDGEKLMLAYVKAYLRHTHPYLPEEGILYSETTAVQEHLTSDELLSYVSSNIGTSDLILCDEFPPTKSTLAKTFKAIVGAIERSTGLKSAQIFVQDFVLTQLIGKDVCEMWTIVNPMGILVDILSREGRTLPESRLVRQSGQNTIMAVFNVGLYCDRQLIGLGVGETIVIAEEMAARDALRRLFRTNERTLNLPFGKRGRALNVTLDGMNPSVKEWTSKLASQNYATKQKNN